jgi:hypothetical protein
VQLLHGGLHVLVPHNRSGRLPRDWLFFQAAAPSSSPRVISTGVGEQNAYSLVTFRSSHGIAQAAEGQREVADGGHAFQQVLSQRRIALALGEEAKLAAEAASRAASNGGLKAATTFLLR